MNANRSDNGPRMLDLGYDLGPVDSWKAFERCLGRVALEAYLLAPSDSHGMGQSAIDERLRIRRVLSAASLDFLVRHARTRRQLEILDHLRGDLALHLEQIARADSSSQYRYRLTYDLDEPAAHDRFGESIKSILTAGLQVRLLHDHDLAGPAALQSALSDPPDPTFLAYRKAPIFTFGDDGVRRAWVANKSIVHIAAGFLDYLSLREQKRRFRGKGASLNSHLVPILSSALYYQNFLIELRKRNRRLRFQTDALYLIPESLGLRATKPSIPLLPPS